MSEYAEPIPVSKSFSVPSRPEADSSSGQSGEQSTEGARKQRCQASEQYMFRAEFAGDADIVQTVVGRSLLSWQQHSPYGGLDTDVTFTIRPGGPTLEQAKWLIDHILDCHVVAESLAPAGRYTGERVWLSEQYPEGLPRPPKRVVDAAIDGLEKYLEFLEAASWRARDAIEAIRTA